ncbi:MAG TPA: hypothetical protein VFQ71_04795 [Gaiellales bacterium]|nr:hypothetical protein [Gaiellales bacterium]
MGRISFWRVLAAGLTGALVGSATTVGVGAWVIATALRDDRPSGAVLLLMIAGGLTLASALSAAAVHLLLTRAGYRMDGVRLTGFAVLLCLASAGCGLFALEGGQESAAPVVATYAGSLALVVLAWSYTVTSSLRQNSGESAA